MNAAAYQPKYPRLATTTGKGRYYTWHGRRYTSVTTILDAINKPALPRWAAKSVAEFVCDEFDTVAGALRPKGGTQTSKTRAAAIDLMKGAPWRTRDEAALRGSAVHDLAEKIILDQPLPDLDSAMEQWAKAIRAFLHDWTPTFEAAEMTVFSDRHGYAGTLDGIADSQKLADALGLDRCRFLLDWKTGKGVYPETALQLAAYRFADFAALPDDSRGDIPEVDAAFVVHLRPGRYRLIPYTAGEREHRTFLYVQQVHEFSQDGYALMADPVMSPRLAPPADPFEGLPGADGKPRAARPAAEVA